MNNYYFVILHLITFFILFILLLVITRENGLLEKRFNIPMYTKLCGYDIRSTDYHIFCFIYGGIWCLLFVLPLMMIYNGFFILFANGIYFLYVGLMMYKRKNVFNDNNISDQINKIYGRMIKSKKERNLRYIDILVLFNVVPFLLIFIPSLMAISEITETQLIYDCTFQIIPFLFATILVFPDKLDNLFKKVYDYSILSDCGLDKSYIYFIFLPIFLDVIVYLIYFIGIYKMNELYYLLIHLIIFFILFILFKTITYKNGLLEKRYSVKKYTRIDENIVKTTKYSAFRLIYIGFFVTLFTLSLVLIYNLPIVTISFGLYFLYIGLIAYKRKKIFNDYLISDEVNKEYGKINIVEGSRRIRYIDIMNTFYLIPSYMYVVSLSSNTKYKFLWDLIFFILPMIYGTVLSYPDILNKLMVKIHGYELLSDNGLKKVEFYLTILPFIIPLIIALYL